MTYFFILFFKNVLFKKVPTCSYHTGYRGSIIKGHYASFILAHTEGISYVVVILDLIDDLERPQGNYTKIFVSKSPILTEL